MGELDYAAENPGPPDRERPSRITKEELARKLRHFEGMVNSFRMEKAINSYFPIADYRLDYANGGVRVETADESRTVSPRLSKRRLADWLDAALRALEEVTRT